MASTDIPITQEAVARVERPEINRSSKGAIGNAPLLNRAKDGRKLRSKTSSEVEAFLEPWF